MKFSEDTNAGSNVIHSYEDREIIINGERFTQSLVIGQQQLIDNWPIDHIDQLSPDHLQSVMQFSPEVILIGTGDCLKFPAVEHYADIIKQGIGIEFMDTRAACRTYNILLSEDRQVIAGLIINT